MSRIRLIFATGVLLAAVACGRPCDRLATELCARGGEGARACLDARQRAERSGPRAQQACDLALDLLHEGASPKAGAP